MFLFTTDYFKDVISRPGGLVDYLSTFLTQFYYISWLGALIIAFLLVILQQTVNLLATKLKKNIVFAPLTFIPSILFFALLCDENYLLSGLLAAIFILLAVYLYALIRKPSIRIIVFIFALPLLYWFSGGIFFIFAILCLIFEWRYFKKFNTIQWIFTILTVLVIVILSPFITKIFLQYPMSRLWWGLSYNRYPVVAPYPILAIWLSLIIIPVGLSFIPTIIKNYSQIFYFSVQIIVLALFGNWLVRSVADWKKEEVMAYDYCARNGQWKQIINFANHKDPTSPLSVTCLNLALAKTGKMGDCMFRYYQNGTEGLLPTFQRDFTSPLVAGEVYYHLGFLNTSMRYAFEAMEAIPDYKKSSRAIKRIAEVNLLNGENQVAIKYLNILQNTLFYKTWATNALKCVGNEKLIDQNSEWAKLRKYRVQDDFLFSEMEKDQMLGLLFTHCMSNKMAYEYLMAYLLLTKDVEHFIQYFPLGRNLGYEIIPAHYQEALILVWSNKSPNLNDAPWPITPAIKQNMMNYIQMSSSKLTSEAQMYNAFSQTYWYYLQYRK